MHRRTPQWHASKEGGQNPEDSIRVILDEDDSDGDGSMPTLQDV